MRSLITSVFVGFIWGVAWYFLTPIASDNAWYWIILFGVAAILGFSIGALVED